MIRDGKITNEPELTEFLSWRENIRMDIKSKSHEKLRKIDFKLLNKSIGKSTYLQNAKSLRWILNSYEKIVRGDYDSYYVINGEKHFANERSYSKKELDAMVDEVSSIEI